jgi:hypothetical protein
LRYGGSLFVARQRLAVAPNSLLVASPKSVPKSVPAIFVLMNSQGKNISLFFLLKACHWALGARRRE